MQANHTRDLQTGAVASATSYIARCGLHLQRVQPRRPSKPKERNRPLEPSPKNTELHHAKYGKSFQYATRHGPIRLQAINGGGPILHSFLRANLSGVQRASHRLGSAAPAMAQPSLEYAAVGARQDDRIQSTRGSNIPSLAPAAMVRQSTGLQSLLHHAASASKMCSATHSRQSGAASTSRPRVAGNGLLRLVVINGTYCKCKLLSYIGHDATILCQGQILQAPFEGLLRFSRKKLNTRTDFNLCQHRKPPCSLILGSRRRKAKKDPPACNRI
jgi:hypothetical protein